MKQNLLLKHRFLSYATDPQQVNACWGDFPGKSPATKRKILDRAGWVHYNRVSYIMVHSSEYHRGTVREFFFTDCLTRRTHFPCTMRWNASNRWGIPATFQQESRCARRCLKSHGYHRYGTYGHKKCFMFARIILKKTPPTCYSIYPRFIWHIGT